MVNIIWRQLLLFFFIYPKQVEDIFKNFDFNWLWWNLKVWKSMSVLYENVLLFIIFSVIIRVLSFLFYPSACKSLLSLPNKCRSNNFIHFALFIKSMLWQKLYLCCSSHVINVVAKIGCILLYSSNRCCGKNYIYVVLFI
jgi:hypothetical protein